MAGILIPNTNGGTYTFPVIQAGDSGKHLQVNVTETGYDLVFPAVAGNASTTLSISNQSINSLTSQMISGDQSLQAGYSSLRKIMFDVVGAYINEVTAALSPLAKLSGFGISFGTADGTVVSTTGGFGYDFGNFFGTYSTSVSATPITVTPSNRGAAAAYYFAQV